jgi:hypothetical protein
LNPILNLVTRLAAAALIYLVRAQRDGRAHFIITEQSFAKSLFPFSCHNSFLSDYSFPDHDAPLLMMLGVVGA